MSRARQPRLGKGLGALLGEYLPPEEGGEELVRHVPVARISPNPLQPRRTFHEAQLAELSRSIEENGLLQPLVVRPATDRAPAGAAWELVAGERRWRAVRRLGWREVPVIVREMDDRTLLVLAIVENVQREDLSPLEEAAGYHELIEEFGFSQQEVAESVGRDRSTIANLLRLLHLPASVQSLVNEGRLAMGHARALLGLPDERSITRLARVAAREGLSVREVESRVRRSRRKQEAEPADRRKPAAAADPTVRRLERVLQRAFGTEVRIHLSGPEQGRVEIPFFDADDFERITERLVDRGSR